MLATLAVAFGVYYLSAAYGDINGADGARGFYAGTVLGRLFIFLSFALLVATRQVEPPLLLLGLINGLGAGEMARRLLKPNPAPRTRC